MRPFGEMAGAGEELKHGASAQAVGEAVDQLTLPPELIAFSEARLGGEERLGDQRGEGHQIDAEARIDGVDLVPQDPREVAGIARRRGEAGLDHGRGAVGAVDREPRPLRTAAGAREGIGERLRKMGKRGDETLMGDQGLGKGELRGVVRGREQRRADLLAAPERLIEAIERRFRHVTGVEAPLEARAGQLVELADALQA